MWVYMETWIVKDGAPELARGEPLRGVGLRAECRSLGPARTAAAASPSLWIPTAPTDPAVTAMN